MANHSSHDHAPATTAIITPEQDFKAHQDTYDGFLKLAKWGIIGLVVLLVFLFIVVQPHIVPAVAA
ncbi:MAG TPA: aa3-type cytochrome c oxidase subunit IV [Arsenicitalea sp.]|jgi:hypothetical protein|nr:aa3-type cytochrome c oxidase subunit IV [Arsenicitalea sp.]